MKKFTFLKMMLLAVVMLAGSMGLKAQLLVENFDYAVGSVITTSQIPNVDPVTGWSVTGTNVSDPIVVTNGLSFSGYAGGDVGGAANVVKGAEDIHKVFTTQTAGTVYTAFLIKTESSNSQGYFFHLGGNPLGTSVFNCRIWVNATGDGINITSSGTAPATWLPISSGTTTLLVIKHDFSSHKTDLFILNSFSATEPSTSAVQIAETLTGLGAVALRQYNSAQRIIVDGIRVGTTWAEAVAPATANPGVNPPVFTPAAGTYTEAQSVTLSSTTTGAKIYYTTDGTEPTSASALYTGAINVAATTTIKAIAYDASNANPSAVVTAQYIINLTPTLSVVPSVVPAMSAYTGAAADTEIIAVSGTNLTSGINAQISGDNASQFSVSPATLTQSGGNFTITYSPSATAATHTASLTLSSTDAVDVVLSLNGQTKLAPNEGTANETFATQTVLTATYASGSFSSETAGVTVNYVHARNEGFDTADDYSISGKGIMLRRIDELSSVEFVIPTGVGSFLFDYRKAFTGGSERKLAVVVDGVESFVTAGFGTLASTNETTVYAFNETINKAGTVSVKITYPAGTPTGNRQVTIDNVNWTAFPSTGLTTTRTDAKARAYNGKILFEAAAGESVEIYNTVGQKLVSTTTVDGLNEVPVRAAGVLVVKVSNRLSKVIL